TLHFYLFPARRPSDLHWDDIDHDPAPATVDLLEEFVIDEAAVTLACSGEQVKLRPQERREGIRRLHAAKLTDGQIATRLHMAPRSEEHTSELQSRENL